MNTRTVLLNLLLGVALLGNRAAAQPASAGGNESRPALDEARSAAARFFWVTETNNRPTRQTIVRFYDHEKQLVYEEKLPGRCLNIHRKRVVKSLNLALADVRTRWVAHQTLQQSEWLVSSRLKR